MIFASFFHVTAGFKRYEFNNYMSFLTGFPVPGKVGACRDIHKMYGRHNFVCGLPILIILFYVFMN